jgi:hypothetical protein
VLELWLHGHGGEGCGSDGPPVHLGGKHAEQDVADDLGPDLRHEEAITSLSARSLAIRSAS